MNPVFRFDFTIPEDDITNEELIEILNKNCKYYVFQLEIGKKGYRHYQGRISVKNKIRLASLIKKKILPKSTHYSITSTNCKTFDYVMKEEGRIGETFIKKEEKYIPRQYRNKLNNLRPFQAHIWNTKNDFDDRIVNYVVCPSGCIGKSVIASLCELYGDGIDLPITNDADKLIASCCNICMSKNLRTPTPIFIDLPKAFNQEKMGGIFSAIENIKKGKLYDMRYNYKTFWIDSPQVWVFANFAPELGYLSNDRWKFWKVNKDYEFEEFTP